MVPFIVSIVSRSASFQIALGVFPMLATAGFLVLAAGGRRVQTRIGAMASLTPKGNTREEAGS